MSRTILSFLVVVGAVLALTVPLTKSADALTANIPPNIQLDCAGVTDLGSSFTADRDNTGSGQEAYIFTGTDGYGNVFHSFASSVPVGFVGAVGNFPWQSAPSANPLTLRFISLAGNGYEEQLVMEVTGECEGLPWVEAPEPELPGCDVLLPIPSTAVGGAFVADAPVYWKPGELTSPLVTIAAGNTARVIGLDASGQYYKIIWGCDFVWVPRATLGPSYDAVWNGAPLPTAVVE